MASSNLNPLRSVDEARSKGKIGGVKSGESRRRKKALRERLELLLAKKINAESGEVVTADAIAIALIEKALTGDVRAFEVIRDTIGEKPDQKSQISGELTIKWEQV